MRKTELTSAGSLTPNLTTNEYQEYTTLAAAFTLDAPTEIEAGFTYDFVITKTNSRFIISWGRVEN